MHEKTNNYQFRLRQMLNDGLYLAAVDQDCCYRRDDIDLIDAFVCNPYRDVAYTGWRKKYHTTRCRL